MMIPAMKAVFLLSLLTFLGTHARTLPEDILKMIYTHHGRASSYAISKKPPKPSPSLPQVNPPYGPIMSTSYVTGISCDDIMRTISPPPSPQVNPSDHPFISVSCVTVHDKIIRMPRLIGVIHKSPPPAPYVAPPHTQTSAYHRRTPTLASARGKLMSSSHVNGNPDNEITRPAISPPPPPYVAPPHVQIGVYATE